MNDLLYGGGVEKVMMDISSNLDDDLYDITILTPYEQIESKKYYKANIKLNSIYGKQIIYKNILGRLVNKITRIIKYNKCIKNIYKQKFDVAIAIKEGFSMKFISNLNIPKKIAWIHTDYSVFHWTKNCFKSVEDELECMKKFNSVVCVSKNIKDITIQVIGDSKNLCVKYNPINEKEIIDKSIEQVNDIEKNDEKLTFVTVGRLTEQKGYDRLLNVCKILNDKYKSQYELWIIGEGYEYNKLKNFIHINNLDNVKLLGAKENPYKYIRLADWFICSSIWESFGIAIQESIVLNTPVIATYSPGSCEIIEPDYHGIIVDNSEIGILQGMEKAITNNKLNIYYIDKMSNYNNKITLDNTMNEIIKLF